MRLIGTIEIQFHSWWRTTSGQVDGDQLDEVMMRSPDGLPWLPGRTVKGLLRDAAMQLVAFDRVTTEELVTMFGQDVASVEAPNMPLAARFLTRPGALRFGSAEMDQAWRTWAQSDDDRADAIKATLFDARAMTAIDETGVAKTSSLRRVQVAVPLQLFSPVWQNEEQGDSGPMLSTACRMIKSLGAGRNRGFGRVEMRFAVGTSGEEAA